MIFDGDILLCIEKKISENPFNPCHPCLPAEALAKAGSISLSTISRNLTSLQSIQFP